MTGSGRTIVTMFGFVAGLVGCGSLLTLEGDDDTPPAIPEDAGADADADLVADEGAADVLDAAADPSDAPGDAMTTGSLTCGVAVPQTVIGETQCETRTARCHRRGPLPVSGETCTPEPDAGAQEYCTGCESTGVGGRFAYESIMCTCQ